ncbi:MAG: glycosyltransferase family 9 protein [Bacteroidales bacterium]|nr:glycosyltransferase family 9 protein [Bacteroidales bacterium]
MKKLFLYLLILYYDIESLMLRLVKSKRQSDTLILRTDNIGDFILWLDSASEIRKRLNGRITLLCSSAVASFARNIAYFDEIQTIDTKKFFFNPIYRFKLLKKLKVQSYDLILNPLFSRDYFIGDTIVRNVCAKRKIGFGQDYNNTESRFIKLISDKKKRSKILSKLLSKSNGFYSSLIETDKEDKMELKRNAEFVSKFFDCDFKASLPKLCFEIPEFNQVKDYVVLFIGASQVKRNWGGKKFVNLIDRLSSFVVLCGGDGDIEIADNILRSVKQSNKILNLVGKTNLLELCSVINSANLVISNDTVAAHISALVRTKSIVICPGNFRKRFHPYDLDSVSDDLKQYFPVVIRHEMDCFDCAGNCTQLNDDMEHYPCIENISVDMVVSEINRLKQE